MPSLPFHMYIYICMTVHAYVPVRLCEGVCGVVACLPMFTFVYTSCHYITVIGIILLGATSKSSVFRRVTIMIGGKVLRDGSEEQAKLAVYDLATILIV